MSSRFTVIKKPLTHFYTFVDVRHFQVYALKSEGLLNQNKFHLRVAASEATRKSKARWSNFTGCVLSSGLNHHLNANTAIFLNINAWYLKCFGHSVVTATKPPRCQHPVRFQIAFMLGLDLAIRMVATLRIYQSFVRLFLSLNILDGFHHNLNHESFWIYEL